MLLESSTMWMVVGLVSGLIGVFMARKLLGPRGRTTRIAVPPPPASRQERRKRERQADKR
jgi:hypothetical protein